MMEKETELRNKAGELIQSIDDGEKFDPNTVTELFKAIFALKAECKTFFKTFPKEFLCPISKNLMGDPVVIASGQTYDRSSLGDWQRSGKNKSPRTNKVLPHVAIAPNHLVRELILKWCKSQGVREPIQRRVEEQPRDSDFTLLRDTLKKMYNTRDPPLQKLAVKELLRLIRERPVFQALFAKHPNVIPDLIKMLTPPGSDQEIDPQLHEDMITIMLNLSADERNKQAVSNCPTIIPFLIQALNAKKLEIRCNAAATIYQMSLIYTNKEIIGTSGVLKPLIELLQEKWSPQASRDAMDAIFSLCENKVNVLQAVHLGVVPVVAGKIVNRTFVDELLPMLKLFSVYKRAVKELESLECVPMLLSIVRENPSDVSKENAILILHNVFEHNRQLWVDIVREFEQNRITITQISQTGTLKAKIKANAIIESLNKDTATSSSITRP